MFVMIYGLAHKFLNRCGIDNLLNNVEIQCCISLEIRLTFT